jgi:hypothetical protein
MEVSSISASRISSTFLCLWTMRVGSFGGRWSARLQLAKGGPYRLPPSERDSVVHWMVRPTPFLRLLAVLACALLLLRAAVGKLQLRLHPLECRKCTAVDVRPARISRLAEKRANDTVLPI